VRGPHRETLILPALGWLALLLAACGNEGPGVAVPGHPGALKSAAAVRAERRAFDGAPPVIPHQPFGAACTNCHTPQGINLPGVGFAPPMPHAETKGMHGALRCTQCHVGRTTDDVWRASGFVGLRQDLRRGKQAFFTAPPVIPHALQMRENCQACHSGPAAREEIRCDHPERVRCTQCHLPRTTGEEFARKRE
jgi:nitrate reductase cytochrome c-type subunit